ncbi:MAG TPA: N-acyl homoserine lactonase family protein [Solirubrobacteraceae bacterium]|nr:N-acyl homoserine lactonase family protein [Solirubrobacteraceae bacterium]
MTSVRRVIPLIVGWERLPKSYSIHEDASGAVLVEPVPVLVLETDDGWTLLDTGINTALMHDRPLYERLHGRNHAIVPILPAGEGEPLQRALAAHGIALSDIARIYLSHLHNDHAGGLRLFARSVPVWVQRRELEYGLADHPFPERHGMFRIDYDDPDIDWRLLDGDAELAPGIHALLTPGHTPGHQSFVIDLPGGEGFVFAFDAADLRENIDGELAVGGFVHCEAQDTIAPIRRLKQAASARGYRVIPGHDPDVWPALIEELTPGAPVPQPP